MAEKIDCVVVGAGVVGLAAARALAMRGRETLVLEAERAIGTSTSSRNSEVIHAGIYYRPGSAKARLCLRGKELLYRYCAASGVPFRRCGKLIVATDAGQLAALGSVASTARANGVDDLRRLEGSEARALEPALTCVAALLSPSTGIVDSHSLMLALQADLERAGGAIALRTPVRGGVSGKRALTLAAGSEEAVELEASVVVNSAGLEAQALARSIEGVRPQSVPPLHLAKGSYFALEGRAPFERLIYPIPEPGGLGVHLTLDLAAQARFGPDVEWVDRIQYEVDLARADDFYAAVRRYWPELPAGALRAGYAGIRPKLSGPGAAAADFLIQGPEAHGARGLLNLFGIESPGLTSALAIGEYVADVVESWE